MTGQLPQSTALAEARVDSISELLSRDPEGHTRQDRDRVVKELREQRARWEASQALGTKPKPKTATKVGSLVSRASSGDLGL